MAMFSMGCFCIIPIILVDVFNGEALNFPIPLQAEGRVPPSVWKLGSGHRIRGKF